MLLPICQIPTFAYPRSLSHKNRVELQIDVSVDEEISLPLAHLEDQPRLRLRRPLHSSRDGGRDVSAPRFCCPSPFPDAISGIQKHHVSFGTFYCSGECLRLNLED